ncbi:uncharacterized protein LOC106659864 [Trichogramma pretiosum]|uniref:uncharacterized protein LOC106659864 n=1 Tax=Trichogramma pretiosum TaxID=7493 RepID=UPI0006C9C513|nr:uncharacterized protein LOC106659864 [Trichogramma pretiosum]
MSFSESDFSSNEELDNIQVGDATVDVVGRVCRVSDNFDCKGTKNKYIKIVVNNNTGRQIQVTAWNNLTHLLEEIKEIDEIVYVGNVKAQKVSKPITMEIWILS